MEFIRKEAVYRLPSRCLRLKHVSPFSHATDLSRKILSRDRPAAKNSLPWQTCSKTFFPVTDLQQITLSGDRPVAIMLQGCSMIVASLHITYEDHIWPYKLILICSKPIIICFTIHLAYSGKLISYFWTFPVWTDLYLCTYLDYIICTYMGIFDYIKVYCWCTK